ncbi:hypothetical protein EJ08DRAFT_665645 [Tothia fuscella]|uniref:Uncharacterized protein n=1 Tax=Tothia fuscella TaxID=1048955 RepID=A0A9P4NG89_9PEZI|nr:hypothetical protein EJ08DRAFT_665645 [Tothia fuscella]
MFSKLRQHKRSGSTPTSPTPNSLTGFLQPPPNSSHGSNPGASPLPVEAPSPSPFYFNKVEDSPVSPFPPSLPPIPRVASVNKDVRRQNKVDGPEDSDSLTLQKSSTRDSDRNEERDYKSRRHHNTASQGLKEERDSNFRRHQAVPSQETGDGRYFANNSSRSNLTGEASAPPTSFDQILPPQHDSFRSPESQSSSSSFVRSPPMNPKYAPPRRPQDYTSPPTSSHDRYIDQATPSVPHPFGTRDQIRQAPPTAAVPQKGRTKLHLLNPMSLLMRRRNAQAVEQLREESLVTQNGSVSKLPDNYDPSIRGKVVHDFSAPRPRRNFSSQGLGPSPATDSRDSTSRECAESSQRRPKQPLPQHTPHFKENFEEETDIKDTENAIRAETLANKDFVARNSFTPPVEDSPTVLPPFARTAKTVYKPEDVQQQVKSHPVPPVQTQEAMPMIATTSGLLSPLLEDTVSPSPQSTPDRSSARTASSSKRKPPSSRSRVPSRTSVSPDQGGLPSHMFSRSSRFSFQYANTDSAAQEKLLEEKHKKKAAASKAKALAAKNDQAENDQSEEEEDDFDYDDDMDGYDDMEEDVPMVGEEWDYGGGEMGAMPMNGMMMDGGGGLTIEQAQMALRGNPVDPGLFTNLNIPMGSGMVQGLGILPAFEEEEVPESQVVDMEENESQQQTVPIESIFKDFNSIGPTVAPSNLHEEGNERSEPFTEQTSEDQDDDFYFDDGGIDGDDFDEASKFDESVFDDPSGPLFERPAISPPPIPAKSIRRLQAQNTQRQTSVSVPKLSDDELLRKSVSLHPDPTASRATVSAYHDALALAATKAAAEGRFARHDSLENSTSDASQFEQDAEDEEGPGLPNVSSRPSLIPDDSRLSEATLSPPPVPPIDPPEPSGIGSIKAVNFHLDMPAAYNHDPYSSDWDYSDYDSAMEDDPIIAAANAEALENDDDGFYGSEFGFYARPGSDPGAEPGEAVLGGYFGPKTWGEIKRNRSTREPNLTPITERSEYSTRNSLINLPEWLGERGAPSPGLAQLARMSSGGWEGEMSMEALRRLRKGAWGGSNGSRSSGQEGGGSSPMNSSPVVANPRALWSSPMGRSIADMSGGGDIVEDHSYVEHLDEDPYGGFDDEVEGDWEDASDRSSDTDYEGSDEDIDPGAEWHYHSSAPESPTIRAQAFQTSRSPSPTMHSVPRLPTPNTGDTLMYSPLTTGSTTLTVANTIPSLDSRPSSLATTNSQPTSPTKSKFGHSRNGSDSVAYVKEREDSGQVRWFLERRRTGEDGVESLVGRTLVEGGRI